jgi:ferritin-like protein
MPKSAVLVESAVTGFESRVGKEFMKASKAVRKEFFQFVKTEIPKLWDPLPCDTEFSVEDWLANSKYNSKLCARFRKLHQEFECYQYNLPRKYSRCKGFIKDECYPEKKIPRTINSRHDVFKSIVGPVFNKLDKAIFKKKCFVKHIKVNDRPDYIIKRCGLNGPFIATDYSSFESSFDPKFLLGCEMVVYEYLLSRCPDCERIMRLLRQALCGYNVSYFKWFRGRVYGRRMSGEMCTSSGNGLTNMLLMRFIAFRLGSQIRGVVEGDDGLFSVRRGPIPGTKHFADLGFDVKLVIHNELNTASFCGLIFDLNDKCNIVDPVKVVTKTPWMLRRYVTSKRSIILSLLRCKAYSLLAQNAGCPIIQSYALYLLRNTRNVDHRKMMMKLGWWERQIMSEVTNVSKMTREVGLNTRYLMERIYSISVEHQCEIEHYFDVTQCICPVPQDLFCPLVPLVNESVFYEYTWYGLVGQPDNRPCY